MITDLQRAALQGVRSMGSKVYRRRLQKLSSLDENEFKQFQGKLLQETYSYAVAKVPYYRASHEYPPESQLQEFLQEFDKLPVLEKNVVKHDPSQFLRRPRNKFLLKHTTGGTTGSPLEIFQNPLTRMKTTAILKSSYAKFCGLHNPRTLNLTGFVSGDQLVHYPPFSRSAYLSIYMLQEEMKDDISDFLEEFQPQMIYGYASAIAQLARLFPEGLPNPVLRNKLRCISTSETLVEADRALIESNLDAVVHNQYGSQEGQHFVFECSFRGLHIHPARGFMEILDFDRDCPVGPGETGRVVVTGFQNPDMPLIRYSIGDTATRADESYKCPCGCLWPMIQDIQGRTEDLIRTPDGRRIGLLSHSTLKDVSGIVESQIIQSGYYTFTYRIKKTEAYRDGVAEAYILNELRQRLGYSVTATFEYVENIPKSIAGKHRAVIVDF